MKNALLYLFIFLFAGIATVFAQAPDTMWTRTYGVGGQCVQQTNDGGFIIVGFSLQQISDVYLIKTNINGDTLFTKTYGGNGYEYGESVQQTKDGGYIIAGWTSPSLTGYSDVSLIKTDMNGIEEFSKTYGGDSSDVGLSVLQTQDSGYVIVGSTNSFGAGNSDVYFIKTDKNGIEQYYKAFGGDGNDNANSVVQTQDGGYVIVGSTQSFGAGNYDVYLIKTDAIGDTLFTKTYGGSRADYGYSIKELSINGYIITGKTSSFGDISSDVYLIKTDVQGNTIFTKTYGDNGGDCGYSIEQTNTGCFVIVGYKNHYGLGQYTDVYLIKTDTNGDSIFTKTFGGYDYDIGIDIKKTSDGGYIILGYTEFFGGGGGALLIKLAPEPVGVNDENNLAGNFSLAQNYPNPFNPQTTLSFVISNSSLVTLKVYDVLGQEIATLINNQSMQAGIHDVQFDGSNLQSGMYFYRLQTGNYSETKKLVLLK
ncbi:MAG: T9SS type A sorting domain-containing protein [Bacteroidota bacterium]